MKIPERLVAVDLRRVWVAVMALNAFVSPLPLSQPSVLDEAMNLLSVAGGAVDLLSVAGDAVDLLSVAGGAVGAVLEAASQPTCSFILLTDGTTSPSTIFKLLRAWRGCPWGGGVLEAAVGGLDPNTTMTLLSQLVLQARRVRLGSWCVWVVVASLDTTFLAAFAERSVKGRLLAWGTKLLVVTRLPLTQLHALLSSHWTFSMMAAIFLNLEPTLNTLSVGVYTHLPYSLEGAQVVKVASWGLGLVSTPGRSSLEGAQVVKVASWGPGPGLVSTPGRSLFPAKFSNFYGATVNVTALPFPPYWDEWKDSGMTTLYSGTDYYMLASIAKALNFTIRVVPTASWAEVTQRVEERVALLAAVFHNVLPDRLERFDYSWVYEFGSLDFSMAQPGLKPQWQALYYPLAGVVWLSSLLALLLAAAVLLLLVRTSEQRGGMGRTDASVVVHQLTGMLLGQNLPRRLPTTSSCRILVMVWLVFGLIIGTLYRGNLTAFLMLPKYPPRAETLHQLVTAADRITMQSFGAEFKQFFSKSDSPVFQRLGQLLYIVPSVEIGQQQAVEKKQAHLDTRRYQELKIAELFTREDGSAKLYIGRESILPGQSAWPIPHDAPYQPVLDRCLMAVVEAGLYEKWSTDLLSQAQAKSRKRQQKEQQKAAAGQEPGSDSSLRALTTTHLQGAFMLLLLGIVLAGLTFILEILTLRVLCNRG